MSPRDSSGQSRRLNVRSLASIGVMVLHVFDAAIQLRRQMLALQKMRSGGQQTVRVVHQHVTVNDGAQAVVAGEMNTEQPTGGRRKRNRGGTRK